MWGKTASLPLAAAGSAARRRGLWRLVLLGVILAVLASYISPVRSYLERTDQIEKERLITEEVSRQHDVLLKERQRLQSNEYVEQVARRDLGLVRPGEQSYVVKDLDKEEGADNPSSGMEEEEKSLAGEIRDWLDSFLP